MKRENPVTTEPGQWEIATSCDIRLGPIFGSHTNYDGNYYVDVDTEAIAVTLQQLDPDAHGSLHFEVSNAAKGTLKTHGAVGGARRHNKPGEPSVSDVMIGLNSNRRPKIIRHSSEIQKTAIHELQHVADHSNTDLALARDRRRKYAIPAILGLFATSELAFYVIGTDITGLVTGVDTLKAIGGAAAAMSSLRFNFGASAGLINYGYTHRELEKRAKKAGRDSHRFPEIVTLKPVHT